MNRFPMGRRAFLKTGAAAVAAAALPRVAFAAPKTVKIGLVAPITGPLAIFTEQLPWTIEQIKAFTNGQVDVGGTKHPLEIIVRDSQSNPNRAAEVAKGLILQDKVDLITTFATPETVNPVADQAKSRACRACRTTARSSPTSSAARAIRRRASTGPTTTSSAP